MRPTAFDAAACGRGCMRARRVRVPSAVRRSGARPPTDRDARLVFGVASEHERRARRARTRTRARRPPSITRRPAFDSVCSAWRAPRGPPRIATRNTPRPRTTQKMTTAMTMTMRAAQYRLAAAGRIALRSWRRAGAADASAPCGRRHARGPPVRHATHAPRAQRVTHEVLPRAVFSSALSGPDPTEQVAAPGIGADHEQLLRRLPSRACCCCARRSSRSGSAPPRSRSPSAPVRCRPPSRSRRRSTTRSRRARNRSRASARASSSPTTCSKAPASRAAAVKRRQPTSSPLLTGASGRLWISGDGERAPGTAGRKGRHADPLRRAHAVAVRRGLATASTATRRRRTTRRDGRQAAATGASARRRQRHGRRSGDRPRGHPRSRRSRKRSCTLMRHANLSGATPTDVAGQAGVHGAHLAEPQRRPDRRRGAVLGCEQRRAAARRGVLHRELRAGDRTGRDRNLLRGGAELGIRVHAPGEREGRGSRRSPTHSTTPAAASGYGPSADGQQAAGEHARRRPRRRSRCSKARQGRAPSRVDASELEELPKVERRRRERKRAADAAGHAADLRARGRALPARRLGHSRTIEDVRARPLEVSDARPSRCRRRGAWSSATRRSWRSTTST